MNDPAKNPFDLLVEQIRAAVREEIAAGLKTVQSAAANREWLKAAELADLYGLPATWFEERGRAGEIQRTKPGRYVLFKRRDVEASRAEQKRGSRWQLNRQRRALGLLTSATNSESKPRKLLIKRPTLKHG